MRPPAGRYTAVAATSSGDTQSRVGYMPMVQRGPLLLARLHPAVYGVTTAGGVGVVVQVKSDQTWSRLQFVLGCLRQTDMPPKKIDTKDINLIFFTVYFSWYS